jgi:hypothetical protein
MTHPAQKINYQTSPKKINLTDLIEKNNRERGLTPLALEPEILLKRVIDGGYSGQFLADAFISMYRGTDFPHSLNGLIKLDTEAFRLFHEILHAKFIPGWSDDELYEIEQKIKRG